MISPLSAPQRTGSQWSLSGSGGVRHDEFQSPSSATAEHAPPVEKQSQLNTASGIFQVTLLLFTAQSD